MNTVSRPRPTLAEESLDAVADTAQAVREHAAPVLVRAAEQAGALLDRGAEAVRGGTQQLREKAQHASERTVDYVRAEPVKSVLVAAAAGAALMALVQLARGHSTR
ncbi:MAG: hypothetical protein KF788_14355 [Piscinibacter sp.]|nr:hypothetical protein [Piscinibacter sp.]